MNYLDIKKSLLQISNFFTFLFFGLNVLFLFAQESISYKTAFPNLSFEFPVELQNAGDDSDRIFVVEQSGKIKVFQNKQDVNNQEIFLDLSNEISFSAGQEIGLLGLAFHPNYKQNGFFYVYYTSQSEVPNVGVEINLARYEVSLNNLNKANVSSKLEIFSFDKNQSNSNHNGGKIAFGPDGYLYISVGDGGGGGDPKKNAQNLDNIFGSILRIDVDIDGSNPLESNSDLPNGNYEIPEDNPRVGLSGLGELYAWGIRNTWKFSFDSENGNFWGADVGQDDMEEINLIKKGGNYGWNRFEGNTTENIDTNLATNPDIKPIFQYNHDKGDVSITGGYVYRGQSNNSLIQGKYIYADYVSGRVWSLDYDANSNNYISELLFRTNGEFISSFGLDESGELYFSGYGTEAKIYKIVGGEVDTNPSTVPIDGIGVWKDIENGVNGIVETIVEKDGNVYVGGSFSQVGNGVSVNNFAIYDKIEGWKSLGGDGPNGKVKTIAITRTGDLYIGGEFSSIDGVSVQNIAFWNGSNWSSLNSGINGPVSKIVVDSKGNVYAGGTFETAGGKLVNNIAVWKENKWEGLTDLGSSIPGTNNEIRSIAIDENDTVYFGGNFDSAGNINANRIATWNGVNWGTLGDGTSGFVHAILVKEDYVYVGGNFLLANGTKVNRIARWNITSKEWESLGNGVSGNVNSLAYDGNYLFVGGDFETVGKNEQENYVAKNVARWSSLEGWEVLGTKKNVGIDNAVKSIILSENKEKLYVSGNFSKASEIEVNNIGVWGLSFDCSDERIIPEYQINGEWLSEDYVLSVDEGDSIVLSVLPNNLEFTIDLPSGEVVSNDYSLGKVNVNNTGDYLFNIEGGCQFKLKMIVASDCSKDIVLPEFKIGNGEWIREETKILVDEGTNLVLSMYPNDVDFVITLPSGVEVSNDYFLENIKPSMSGNYLFTTSKGCISNFNISVIEDQEICPIGSIIPEYQLNNIWYSGNSNIEVEKGDNVVLSMLPNGVNLEITLPDGEIVADNYDLGSVTTAQSGKYILKSEEGCVSEININVIDKACSSRLIPEYQINGTWESGNADLVIKEGSSLVLSMLPNEVDLEITLPNGKIVGDNYNLGFVDSTHNGIYILTSSEGCQKEINVKVEECKVGSVINEYQLDGVWLSGEDKIQVDRGTSVVLSMLPNNIGLEITLPNGEIVGDNYDLGLVDASKNGVYKLKSEEGCISFLEIEVACPFEMIIPEYQLNGVWQSGENDLGVIEGTEVVLSMLPNNIGLDIKLPNGALVNDNYNLGAVTTLDNGIYTLISEEGCKTFIRMNVVKPKVAIEQVSFMSSSFIENKKSNIIDDVIRIYPNPTKGELSIDMSGKLNEALDVKILNSSGQVVRFVMYNENHKAIEKLDLSEFTEGVYHVILEGVNFNNSKTVIIEK
ncbi:PQQ-dependent sugar dehydrogenase [uncultured Maribacter sp.]|uniref:PQQ-dependent sugar dehydrogenase n=1 Tax=uncultured Maribacter sp. TaxID=431308 RepID=UPI00260BAEA1|nr:PQQ-dependent sugar dehydrogenase [uncultured Maribacter sp.]